MMHIRIHKGEWMDEIPDTDPVPALDHVYTFMLMDLGVPELAWLLNRREGPMTKILKIRHQFDLSMPTEALFMQFFNWYEREAARKKRTP